MKHFLQRFGKSLFDFALEAVLEDIGEPVAILTFSSGGPSPCEIRVVNPLSERSEVAGGAEGFEASYKVAVGERVAADINFSDDSNQRFAEAAIKLYGRKVVCDRSHKLRHLREGKAVFNGLCPPADGVVVDLLRVTGIYGERSDAQN